MDGGPAIGDQRCLPADPMAIGTGPDAVCQSALARWHTAIANDDLATNG